MSNVSSPLSTSNANQSPEQQLFEMPLFPGYAQLEPSTVTTSAAPIRTPQDTNHGISAELTALQQQQAAISEQMRQQEHITHERIKGLQHQLDRQEKRHQNEMLQLTKNWQRQQATFAAKNKQEQTTSAAKPATPPATHKAVAKSPLKGISTTYRVPVRAQNKQVDRSLAAIPAFIWLAMLGMGIAGVSAIALSPTLLWPGVSAYISSAIPLIFVIGLVGLGITTVWDSFR